MTCCQSLHVVPHITHNFILEHIFLNRFQSYYDIKYNVFFLYSSSHLQVAFTYKYFFESCRFPKLDVFAGFIYHFLADIQLMESVDCLFQKSFCSPVFTFSPINSIVTTNNTPPTPSLQENIAFRKVGSMHHSLPSPHSPSKVLV